MLHWLPENDNDPFPPLDSALTEPNGLLAAGGSLTPQRLINAYRLGIFPWFNEDEPILWWSPDPRCVLFPEKLKISRSLRKTLNKHPFEIRFDTHFKDVMLACAQPRAKQQGTWISQDLIRAYCRLHELGIAHSVECWDRNQLAGGLYGIALGQVFFGESMFSRQRDASKVALVALTDYLVSRNFRLIDCQVYSDHLASLGAEVIPRPLFSALLKKWCPTDFSGKWRP